MVSLILLLLETRIGKCCINFIISVNLILKDKIKIIETAAKLIVEISGKQYQQAAVHKHAWQLPGKKC